MYYTTVTEIIYFFFQAEAIVDAQERDGEIYYKVLWNDNGPKQSWEVEANLESRHNSMIVEQYKIKHKRKMTNIIKRVDAVRQGDLSDPEVTNNNDELRPQVLDLEEIVEGMDKATALVHKQLHYDNHLYTPTEQETTSIENSAGARRTLESNREKTNFFANVRSRTRGRPKKPLMHSTSDSENAVTAKRSASIDTRRRGRGRPRKLVFDTENLKSKDSSEASESTSFRGSPSAGLPNIITPNQSPVKLGPVQEVNAEGASDGSCWVQESAHGEDATPSLAKTAEHVAVDDVHDMKRGKPRESENEDMMNLPTRRFCV
ncbi:unnamed protein product [Strongylus vulgaris]|uniref:Chromo domain-containing protein n=1 Tax=Strongylus vulgaris TaxID=40348 RepID=A0A3P7IRP8_STRVU|nr:unnamed protein product [Strongylus vulgaris]